MVAGDITSHGSLLLGLSEGPEAVSILHNLRTPLGSHIGSLAQMTYLSPTSKAGMGARFVILLKERGWERADRAGRRILTTATGRNFRRHSLSRSSI